MQSLTCPTARIAARMTSMHFTIGAQREHFCHITLAAAGMGVPGGASCVTLRSMRNAVNTLRSRAPIIAVKRYSGNMCKNTARPRVSLDQMFVNIVTSVEPQILFMASTCRPAVKCQWSAHTAVELGGCHRTS